MLCVSHKCLHSIKFTLEYVWNYLYVQCALYVDKCSYNTIHKIMYAYNINILSKDSDLSNYKKYFLVLMQSVMFLASYRILSSEALFINCPLLTSIFYFIFGWIRILKSGSEPLTLSNAICILIVPLISLSSYLHLFPYILIFI